MEGVASGQSAHSERRPPEGAVSFDGLDEIRGARGMEPARRPHQRRERELIQPQCADRESFRDGALHTHPLPRTPGCNRSRSVALCSCCQVDAASRFAAPWRAITTISRWVGMISRCRRNHSRMRRLTRFRTTAFPTRRLAVIPSLARGASSRAAAASTTKAAAGARVPSRDTRWKSRLSRSRSQRRRRCSPSGLTCWRS